MGVLQETAAKMTASHKGLLAADESTGTIGKRFADIGLDNTEENRQAYRHILLTSEGMEQYISGVILYEETLFQNTVDGRPFVEVLQEKGVVPGIKVDTGMRPIGGKNEEMTTQGFDDLSDRCAKYFAQGARFTKWRAAIEVSEDGSLPSDLCIEENARGLARYAAISQENGLVPIVEPEVLMNGSFSMDTYAEVTKKVQLRVFELLNEYGVDLTGMILKPNMIIPSSDGGETATPEEVATRTLEVLRATVPAEVPGIMFLSGGQSEQEAEDNLKAINEQANDGEWVLSYSYGRALQDSARKAWMGKAENAEAASQAYLDRARSLSESVR